MAPANRQAVARWLREAAGRTAPALSPYLNASLVAVQDAAIVMAFDLQDLVPDIAVPLPDATRLQPLLDTCRGIDCVFGFVEVSSNFNYYNAAAYVSDGKILHVHRKLYLPTYGMFDEMRFFAMGENLRTFQTQFGELGLLICEDLWHPSTIYLHAQEGAQVVSTISSSPGRGVRHGPLFQSSEGWTNLLKTTAQFYTLYNIYVNRVGFEDGVGFWGGSEVIAPTGQALLSAPLYDEGMFTVDIAPADIRRERIALPSLYYTHRREVVRRRGLLVPVTAVTSPGPRESVEQVAVRFRTVGDMTCTCPVESVAADAADVVGETLLVTISERGATRMDDRTSDASMERRKKEGYF
jgi:predicted amidohydrolase